MVTVWRFPGRSVLSAKKSLSYGRISQALPTGARNAAHPRPRLSGPGEHAQRGGEGDKGDAGANAERLKAIRDLLYRKDS